MTPGIDPNGLDSVQGEIQGHHRQNQRLAEALGEGKAKPAKPNSAYLEGLATRRALADGEEATLIEAAKAHDRTALETLIEHYLPRIGSVARTYRTSTVERTELLQEGVVGFLRALERFDQNAGASLWTYASWWVRQAMQQLVTELRRPVVLSDRALRQLSRLKDAHAEHVQQYGKEPSRTQLADATGIDKEQISNLLFSDQAPRSLEEPVVAEEDAISFFGDLLRDPLAEGEYERVVDAFETQELRALLAALTDREREILEWRYGVNNEQRTLFEVGEQLGLSAERVRQLENRALGKLRARAASGKAIP